MVLTSSTKRPLGSPAAPFRLPNADGKLVGLDDYADDPALLVVFWCNHCPFVKHIKAGFAEFAREYIDRGLGIVAINANDIVASPQDGPEEMRRDTQAYGYTFEYLLDESQDVARAYDAACTPDFFLFDAERKLVYHGQFDPSRPRNDVPVTGKDLRGACDAVLAGEAVAAEQTPSIGCNIKWR